jgi:tRNA threonylcarbamoyl adenosine modification protein YeaZ
LVLATSGPAGEVGLHRAGEPLERRLLGAGAARGRGLLPAVEALLSAASLEPGGLGGIAVDVGPGSFTGVRVGVTAAKTLAWALKVPVVGVVSLEVLAGAAPPDIQVLAVRDAGRGTVYAALFGPVVAGARALLTPAQRLEGTALAAWSREALLVGEEAPRLAALFGLPQRPALVNADAAAVLAAALPRLSAGGRIDPSTLVPLYLQASAPERLRAGEAPGAVPARGSDRSSPP